MYFINLTSLEYSLIYHVNMHFVVTLNYISNNILTFFLLNILLKCMRENIMYRILLRKFLFF